MFEPTLLTVKQSNCPLCSHTTIQSICPSRLQPHDYQSKVAHYNQNHTFRKGQSSDLQVKVSSGPFTARPRAMDNLPCSLLSREPHFHLTQLQLIVSSVSSFLATLGLKSIISSKEWSWVGLYPPVLKGANLLPLSHNAPPKKTIIIKDCSIFLVPDIDSLK